MRRRNTRPPNRTRQISRKQSRGDILEAIENGGRILEEEGSKVADMLI